MSTSPVKSAMEETTEEESAVFSGRRIWKRHDPGQGSLSISLKAMDVLYDAAQPLTKPELIERLIAKLDPYERSYLEAWHLHQRDRNRQSLRRANGKDSVRKAPRTLSPLNFDRTVHVWLTQVFEQRLRAQRKGGRTLIKDEDGRYRPGPKAPEATTADGRVVRYTPEIRETLTHEEHEEGRTYLAKLELEHVMKGLDLTTTAAKMQFFSIVLRRLLLGNSPKSQLPLDERIVAPALNLIVRQADTNGIKRRVLEHLFSTLWDQSS
jgi:hypothetical protein